MNKQQHTRSPLVSTAQVKSQTGLSNTSLWRKAKQGTFPVPVYLGQKKMWYQFQIDKWLDENLKTKPTHNNLEPKTEVLA
ncbi:MAG: AlpA family phage regulatory protein [Methylococcaceae bacterium]|nr:AlpA family phage regulatory protein [Methylococcaceae bacterium]